MILEILREFKLLKGLSHENILGLKDCFYWTVKTTHVIVVIMEYANKGNISSKSKKINLKKLANIFQRVIFSLVFMKENKISHLNLKPRNILLNKEVIKIADFLGPKSSESDYVSP